MTNETWNLPVLPQGWIWTNFESISGELKAGGTPLTKVKKYYDNGTIPFVKIEDIVDSSKYLYDTKTRITEQGLRNSSAWLVPRDSLLYSMYGSYGEPIINRIEVVTSQAIIAYVPPRGLIVLDYVYYYLKKVRTELTTRGTTQRNLNGQIVKRIPTPLAPFNEQVRIVAKLEELFASLDAGVEGLQRVKAQLKRYRQAVLKYAFEGKLTEEWRREHISVLEMHSSRMRRSDLPILPDKWSWVQLSKIAEVSVGHVGLISEYYTTKENGIPLLSTKNTSDKGIVELDEIKYVDRRFAERYESKRLQSGDIIIARHGDSGTASIIPDSMKEAFCLNVVIVRKSKEAISEYLEALFNFEGTRDRLLIGKSGSVQSIVNTTIMKKFEIPLPPLAEQHEIVAEIEQRFSIVDKIEETAELNSKQSWGLRQSILKTAFEGKLVPQDPNDESAEKLLERIREERKKSRGGKGKDRSRKKKKGQLELSTSVK